MTSPQAELELLRSLLEVILAVLASIAYILKIADSLSARARTRVDKARAVNALYAFGSAGLTFLGIILWLGLGLAALGMGCILAAAAVVSVDYLRKAGPASRWETFDLILIWSATTALGAFYIFQTLAGAISKMVDIMTKIVK